MPNVNAIGGVIFLIGFVLYARTNKGVFLFFIGLGAGMVIGAIMESMFYAT